MRFTPPSCPNRACPCNKSTLDGFAHRHGSYRCAPLQRTVARFKCTECHQTFSWATFRFSYRQKKPHLDSTLMRLLCSGVSLRAAARLLERNRKTVPRKMARMAAHSRRLHQALLTANTTRGQFQLDELETFETNRFQPVRVPVLIEKHSYLVLATATAPLRRKGRVTPAQKKKRAEHEALHAKRPTGSDTAVKRCLAALSRHAGRPVMLDSDRKLSYGRLARALLAPDLSHLSHDSRVRRDRANPLFPINHTNAMLRYCLARLRRRSRCVSRPRGWLQEALDMYAAWFNYCRSITLAPR